MNISLFRLMIEFYFTCGQKKRYISFDLSWNKIQSSIKINKYPLFLIRNTVCTWTIVSASRIG